jgi:hypothetical protein
LELSRLDLSTELDISTPIYIPCCQNSGGTLPDVAIPLDHLALDALTMAQLGIWLTFYNFLLIPVDFATHRLRLKASKSTVAVEHSLPVVYKLGLL